MLLEDLGHKEIRDSKRQFNLKSEIHIFLYVLSQVPFILPENLGRVMEF